MPKQLPAQALEHVPDHVLDKHPEFADLLAVAFTDQNGNHTYEPKTDLLIAGLFDTNRDGAVSAGDTIHWGTYPTTFDGSGPRGTFTSPDLLVTNAQVGSFSVDAVAGNDTILWSSDGSDHLGTFQGLERRTNLLDSTVNVLDVRRGPGNPDTLINVVDFSPSGNDGFLDVLILI
jgi:hypothetical protein